MKETMGQIIKKLRKERNLTQEDLAEQLGVTSQAISKWENDYGLPDISQVIPLATVFNVSTDVLFGLYGKNIEEEVQSIINSAYNQLRMPATKECIKKWYDDLQKGVEKHPNNTNLLVHSLEAAISVAYPENPFYDAENGEAVYKKSIREANVIIKNSDNVTMILRAHMIMVLLHAAYGNSEAALEHAEKFPWRTDMTNHAMKANIAHSEKNFHSENSFRQKDLIFHFYSVIDNIVDIGLCYFRVGEYDKAEYSYIRALDLIEILLKEESSYHFFQFRERGDIRSLLAEVYLKQGRRDDALTTLEKMVDCDLNMMRNYVPNKKMNSPILCSIDHNFYHRFGNYKERLLLKLKNPAFDEIRSDERFVNLVNIGKQFVKDDIV